jgi:predicted ATPase
MIERLYLDNYKCFVNFEWQPKALQLVLGRNGTGKTTVFHVLETLREFVVTGRPTIEAFPTSTLTAWDTRSEQTIELELTGNGGRYSYRLIVEHERDKQRSRIKTERLQFDQLKLYEFDGSDAHLFRDDGSAGPTFPFDWSRSVIPTIQERPENKRLVWFRDRMARVYVFAPDPLGMEYQSEAEVEKPDRHLSNLASWLRHLSQESPSTVADLQSCLQVDAIEGFQNFRLERAGETSRVLKFDFDFSEDSATKSTNRFTLSLNELSEGQRCLVALFTMLYAAVGPDTTLCVDEPDNFVALREIQPWLTRLSDRVHDDESCQCLLISHHPELIDYLAADHGLQFFREDAGPIRTKPFEWTGADAVKASEIVARGWE